MKLIIAGSRDLDVSLTSLERKINKLQLKPTIIISGHSGNIDKLGEHYAAKHNLDCHLYIAEWEKYGKRAGPIRNSEMVSIADQALFFWDGVSKGTLDCIRKMQETRKKYYISSAFSPEELVFRIGLQYF